MALPLWPVNSVENISFSDMLFDIIDTQPIHGMNFSACHLAVRAPFRPSSVVLEGRIGWRTVIQTAILHDVLFFSFPLDSERARAEWNVLF